MEASNNRELQGSGWVCYCIPRDWIRVFTRVSQFLRILLSYPLYLVIWESGGLKAGAPHFQILLLNLCVYYVPCALVMLMINQWSTGDDLVFGAANVTLGGEHPPAASRLISNRQQLLVGSFVVYLQLPVIYTIFRQLTLSRSKQRVASGTFCFRPAYRFR